MSSNLFFEKVKQQKNCDNMYEFCLSSSNFESVEAVDGGLITLATNFLYSIAIFSVQKMKAEVTKTTLSEDEEEKMLKVWRIIFNKRENDTLKENEKLLSFVNKYSQDIKTLFNLLRKDKMINKVIFNAQKTKTTSLKAEKENDSKNNNTTSSQNGQKFYKIKHMRSGLNNKHDYVVRLSSTTQGVFKIRTEDPTKFVFKKTLNKLTPAKSLPVDMERTRTRIEKVPEETKRVLMKLNTIDLGNTLFK